MPDFFCAGVEVGSCMRQHSKTPHYLTGICGVRELVCRVRQTAGRVCLTGQRGCVPGQTLSAQPGQTMSPPAHKVIKK